jgi:hypothetical protein
MRIKCRFGIHEWKYGEPQQFALKRVDDASYERVVIAQEKNCQHCNKQRIERV